MISKIKKLIGNVNIYKDDDGKIIDNRRLANFIFDKNNYKIKKKYLFLVYFSLAKSILY